MAPLLTSREHETLQASVPHVECSLDLGRSTTVIAVDVGGWVWQGRLFPNLETCNDRTISIAIRFNRKCLHQSLAFTSPADFGLMIRVS